jgi:hypothetical protein
MQTPSTIQVGDQATIVFNARIYTWLTVAFLMFSNGLTLAFAQCSTCPQQVSCHGLCDGGAGEPVDTCAYGPSGCNSGWLVLGSCCCPPTPILINLDGNHYDLTNAIDGVPFDINPDGRREKVAWTQPQSTVAFLVLDRDGNGIIDDGSELFGNYTYQAEPDAGSARNGFRALAVFDSHSYGGNGDGVITEADSVFPHLRLWLDLNHNGISEPLELRSLSSAGIAGIELDYRVSGRRDRHGNQFRYRSKIIDQGKAGVSRWAWDVLVMTTLLSNPQTLKEE